MQPVQLGDRVQVHYVKRLSDGSVASSRGRPPLELTAGSQHPRLPGLGPALVGLFAGDVVTVSVPPEHAYGVYHAGRVYRWARTRFPQDQPLAVGERVRALDGRGRRRSVRVLKVRGNTVLVDANHRFAGQTLHIKVKVVCIQGRAAGAAGPDRSPKEDLWQDVGGEG